MHKYDDAAMMKGVYIYFIAFQVLMLLIVYSFVYTSFIAVQLGVEKYHLNTTANIPVVMVLLGYPFVLYKTRKLFQKEGKRLRAVGIMMGWSALAIIFLYAYLERIIP